MKKISISFLIAFVIGSVFAFLLFKNLNNNIETVFLGYEEISLFQAGVFSNIDNATSFASSMKSAIVVEDDGFYRVYISILNNKESIAIMEEHFISENINFHVRKLNIKNSEFISELKKYEKILLNATEETTYDAVNKKILNIYKKVV